MNDYTHITAIAFDMIGVLVREEKLISRGFPEFFGDRLRLPLREIKDRYDEGYCIGRLTREEFWRDVLDGDWRREERAFLESRAFAPEAAAVLAQLRQSFDLAVISDMPREWAQIILDAHNVSAMFGTGVYSNDGTGSKKDGGLFVALIDELARPAELVLLIDDRPANLDRAAMAGILGIHLPLDRSSDGHRPDLLQVDGLSDLIPLLAHDDR